jgi:hypothetical protein
LRVHSSLPLRKMKLLSIIKSQGVPGWIDSVSYRSI